MDRRTLIAVAVCIGLLLLYQPLLRWLGLGAYLDRSTSRTATTDTTRASATGGGVANTTQAGGATVHAPLGSGVAPSAGRGAPFMSSPPSIERTYDLDTPLYEAHFTNHGARLLSVELKRYASASGAAALSRRHAHVGPGREVPSEDRVVLAGDPLFAMDLGSGDRLRSMAGATYAVEESVDAAGAVRTLTFSARDSSGLSVRQIWRVRPQDYALDYTVEIQGVPEALHLDDYSLTVHSWPLVTERSLQSDERSLRASSMLGDDLHKDHAPNLLKGPRAYEGNVAWAAVQNRYFLAGVAVADGAARGVVESAESRPLTPDQIKNRIAGSRDRQDLVINSLRMTMPARDRPAHRFVVYFGPVEYFRLASINVRLERAVDLGWTWVLPFSRALLQLLKWLYGLIPNYGVAIILLATLVRVVLHPLNMASMKSQRALARLQPEMERIRAKYKNDATAMNTAIMALYKENKVNPAGGCLPMLVQMPLFVALYSVLFNAIELRQAPFFGWIDDLSAPDLVYMIGAFPIRLLPILMAGSGFLTQALTPTDPSQKPTMYMMNLFMLVFFYSLPSGLVLYWTVMNLLTAAQQWLVMRGDGSPAGVVVVESPAAARRGRKG
ncbi:MAG TPA: membrane protein insertase YidC [Candidatus Udaeobacter sp.]|nr:membrane protein insertase YidC [Candidatus Udaeobacter sp.]